MIMRKASDLKNLACPAFKSFDKKQSYTSHPVTEVNHQRQLGYSSSIASIKIMTYKVFERNTSQQYMKYDQRGPLVTMPTVCPHLSPGHMALPENNN